MAGQNNSADDIIEVIVPELNPSQAIMAIVGGLVLGGIVVYYLMSQANAGKLRNPFAAADIEIDTDPGTSPIPPSYYATPIDNDG